MNEFVLLVAGNQQIPFQSKEDALNYITSFEDTFKTVSYKLYQVTLKVIS